AREARNSPARRRRLDPRVAERLRPAAGHGRCERAVGDAEAVRAGAPPQRAALQRAVPHLRERGAEGRDARPRHGLGRRDGDQHDRAEPDRPGEQERQARARARAHPEGPVAHPVHAVPGERHERRLAPNARRRARRRAAADPRPPPPRHDLPLAMDLVVRATAIFFVVLILTRVIGRRELSQLAPFDLILLIILGDALEQGLTQDGYSVTGAILVVGTIALLQVFMSWVGFRFPPLRPVLEGEPVIIVEDGKPIERNLKRERLTLEEVMESARLKEIGSLAEIRWAVLERNGEISFLKKSG